MTKKIITKLKYYLLPYKMGSNSAKSLANTLNATRIYPDKNYKGFPNHILINWGNSQTPKVPISKCKEVLNAFPSVAHVTNKLSFFRFNSRARKVPAVFTLEKAGYLFDEMEYRDQPCSHKIVCRSVLTGKGGEGITLATKKSELVEAPLYTEYIVGKEYRVHMFKGDVIHIQQKRRMTTEKRQELGIELKSGIRNHDNGYAFSVNNVEPPTQDVLNQCKIVMQDYALDFGAVDIIQDKNGKGWILEINSAPGLEGTTLEKYKTTFENYLKSL